MQAVFYDFMTICANYTKTVVFFCAFCHMVSGAVWWCCRAVSCAVVWCGSVTRCEAFLASFYGFMVSSTSIVLKWLCGRSGASGRVSHCRHGVGCGVSVSGVVLWLSVWLSGGLLWLWWSLVCLCVSGGLCGSSGVLCVVLWLWCCRAVWCRSLLWWSGLVFWCLVVSGILSAVP